MNNTNDSSLKGKWDEVAGKVKQGVGEAVGNDSMANRGTAQEVKGHAEQAWGAVKDAAGAEASDANYDSRRGPGSTAHDMRDSIASAAENVKDHIENGMDDLKRKSA